MGLLMFEGLNTPDEQGIAQLEDLVQPKDLSTTIAQPLQEI